MLSISLPVVTSCRVCLAIRLALRRTLSGLLRPVDQSNSQQSTMPIDYRVHARKKQLCGADRAAG